MIKGDVIKYRTYELLETELKENLGIPETDRIQSFEIQHDMHGNAITIKVRVDK